MVDVWKSNPRKYCEFCDCWFSDNKVSISFHENGKRHKEAVEKKVQEISKKGSEREKAAKDEQKWLEMMEKGAAQAVANDIKSNPRMINHYFGDDVEIPLDSWDSNQPPMQGPSLPGGSKTKSSDSKSKAAKNLPNQTWYEATSPEGHTYYWNAEMGESSWAAPTGGYVTIAQQAGQNAETGHAKSSPAAVAKPEPKAGAGVVKKRSWKERAYGSWNSVQKSEPEAKTDLQLPASSTNARLAQEAAKTEAAKTEATKIVFKTKTVASLESQTSAATPIISFKRRKINAGANSRGKADDNAGVS